MKDIITIWAFDGTRDPEMGSRVIEMVGSFNVSKWQKHFGKITEVDWGPFKVTMITEDSIVIEPDDPNGTCDVCSGNAPATYPYSVGCVAIPGNTYVGTMWGPFVVCDRPSGESPIITVVIPEPYCDEPSSGRISFVKR